MILRAIRVLFFIAAPLIFFGGVFAMAEESPYNPGGQARAHAELWSVWQQHNRILCEAKLTTPFETPVPATENLLYQLVGEKQTEDIHRDFPAIVTWDKVEDLSPELRNDVALRIERYKNGFRGEKQFGYSFGHVIRGAEQIAAYRAELIKEFEKAHGPMIETRLGLVEEDRSATWQRIKTHFLPMFIPAGIGASAGYMIYPSALTAFAGGVLGFLPHAGIPLKISPLILQLRWKAIMGERPPRGDDYSTNHAFAPVFDPGEPPNYFVEQKFNLWTQAFQALRKDEPDAFEKMLKSCQSNSATCPTEEETTLFNVIEAKHAYGFPGLGLVFYRNSQLEKESGHSDVRVTARIGSVYFKDSQTGEPVLIHWLNFALHPPYGGTKKPKEKPATQTQEETGFGGGWVPVPIPIPIKVRTR